MTVEYVIETMSICTHVHVSVCLCKMLKVLKSENDRMSRELIIFTSVFSYLPPPDKQANSHGKQHDQSSHRHDDYDHHWVLFTGRQRHWKGQNTPITHWNKNETS